MPSGSLFDDITTIPSYSSTPLFEYGHSKDSPELQKIDFSLTLERKDRVPLSYEIFPGSIPDVVILERAMEFFAPVMGDVLCVLRRMPCLAHNIRKLNDAEFIMAASIHRKEVRSVFSMASRTVDRANNVILYEGRTMFSIPVSFSIEDMQLKGFFYHDPERESSERSDFHRNLAQKREAIEKLEVRRGIRKTIEGKPEITSVTYPTGLKAKG
jgi:transposase